jgi:hypothetical protein
MSGPAGTGQNRPEIMTNSAENQTKGRGLSAFPRPANDRKKNDDQEAEIWRRRRHTAATRAAPPKIEL